MIGSRWTLAPVTIVAIVAAVATRWIAAPTPAPQDYAQTIAAQREAMKRFAFLDGAWRGPASTLLPNGEKHALTQTERVGPLLDGSIRVVEGRGYEPDGKTGFNALGVISYEPAGKVYKMRSYAQGRVGDFVVTPTPDGFSWEIPAGPATIRYTAALRDGEWHEVGDRIVQGQPPMRFFEMTLKRIGDTDWPAGTPVGPQ